MSHSWINPLSCFVCIWTLITLLYQLRLSQSQPVLSWKTYLLLCAVLFIFSVSYFIGCFFASRLRIALMKKSSDSTVYRSDEKIFYILYGSWAVLSLFELFYCGGCPLIWKLTGDERNYFQYGIPSLHGFLNSLGLVLLGYLVYKLVNKFEKIKLLLLFVLIIYYIFIITRQVLVSAAIESSVIILLMKKDKFKKKIPLVIGISSSVILLGIILFGLLGNFRTGYSNFVSVSRLNVSLPSFLSGFEWVYMYLTMTLANIDKMIMLNPSPLGIGPIASLILPSVVLRHIPNIAVVSDPNLYLANSQFTVSGYFAEAFFSFGILGVIVITILYGLLGGLCERWYDLSQSMCSLLCYAVTLQIIILSFFANMLFYLPNCFQYILILFFFGILHRRKPLKKDVMVNCKEN
ncbi:O-antigen polymerase [Bifidobacterium moukalabense]|uniref:O-antigen polymerase n=1 Tax=Bifidobacterium moukalabense TaxID=1333651 RepID=UPI001FCEE9A4|nr:O-antigen polymerase [Bifidobacterium moukalabense]